MTVKQIAEAVGKNPATVARWVEKTSRKVQEISRKVQEAKATSKPAEYTVEETCEIIAAGMGANAAGIFRANAESAPKPITLESTNDDLDTAFKAALVTLTAMAQSMDKRMSAIETAMQQRAALLPAPAKTPRAELSQLVRSYANAREIEPRYGWRDLYREIYYRLHINAPVRAKNEGVKAIDILEREGLLEQACAIAAEMIDA